MSVLQLLRRFKATVCKTLISLIDVPLYSLLSNINKWQLSVYFSVLLLFFFHFAPFTTPVYFPFVYFWYISLHSHRVYLYFVSIVSCQPISDRDFPWQRYHSTHNPSSRRNCRVNLFWLQITELRALKKNCCEHIPYEWAHCEHPFQQRTQSQLLLGLAIMFLLRNSRIGGSHHRSWGTTTTVAPVQIGQDGAADRLHQIRRHESSGGGPSGVVHHGIRVPGVPPPKAKVVVCGGGVMGAAVAYYLGLSGWGEETVLIEQQQWEFGAFIYINILYWFVFVFNI